MVSVNSPMWKRHGCHRKVTTVSQVFCRAGNRRTEARGEGRGQGQFTRGLQGWKSSAKDKALGGTVIGGAKDSPPLTGHALCRKCPFSSECIFVSEPGDMVINSDQTSRFQNHFLIYLQTMASCSLRILLIFHNG